MSTVLESIEDARALGHTYSLAHALQRGALTMALVGDVDACRILVDELHPLAPRRRA